mgnify:CR=1 FL=1
MKKQFDIKKLVLLNLPYLLMGLFTTNFGEAWRLAQGANASEKFLSLLLSCLGRCKASGPACTRWICWWGCAAVLACVWRCISKVKTPRSTVTAWSMVLPVGEPMRTLHPTSTRYSRTM